MRKHALRILGMSLLSLIGVMAFAAAGAQAEGAITILTSTGLATGKTFTGAQEGVARLVAPALNIEIECKGMTILEGVIISGPSGKVLTKLLHSECKVFHINVGGGKEEEIKEKEELPNCQILDAETGTAGHITSKANYLVILHSGVSYLLATPDGQTFFAKVNFTKGIGCVLMSGVEIKGSAMFEVALGDINRDGEKVEPLVRSNQAIQTLFEPTDKLLYGMQPAYIVGSAKLKLNGAGHVGCKWGAV